ncbi:SGNH/GDSL hydrolase family protein [Streptomyces gamaensis]|uniref:SGNH/GDSL hydrolase family protein n=1 Tax=Streptomyces gamaensis TaxID=1763542 RepID=A0ABW0Z890_9ACTN
MRTPERHRGTGYALLAALAAVAVLVSAAIFVGAGGLRGGAAFERGPREAHGTAAPATAGQWIATWGTAPSAAEPAAGRGFAGTTVRNAVHASVGGTAVRIRLSNLYGNRPLAVTHASIALAARPGGPAAEDGTMRRLTFDGQPTATVPAGQALTSDPVLLAVPDAAGLLVSTYSPTSSGPATFHYQARQTSYLAHGDQTEDPGAAYTLKTPFWRYLTGVDVWTQQAQGTVVAFGDSITDGVNSTPNANHRWPDFLAARLREEPGAPRYGVVNAGISGNRVLLGNKGPAPQNNPSALDRFDRDVLDRSGVRTVVVLLGVNDILRSPRQTDPHRIVAGLEQLVERAHRRGLRVVGSTLMPFAGHSGPQQNAVRQGVNELIRAGGVFDVLVDLDAAMRDPAAPQRLKAAYDSGDHLHPNDAGYRHIARTIDLSALRPSTVTAL